MTDIEKKTFKVTLIRAVAICLSVIACTWKLSGDFNRFIDKIDGIEKFVVIHAKKDSVRDEDVAQLKISDAIRKRDIDSIKKALVISKPKLRTVKYFTQRRVNGKLITMGFTD